MITNIDHDVMMGEAFGPFLHRHRGARLPRDPGGSAASPGGFRPHLSPDRGTRLIQSSTFTREEIRARSIFGVFSRAGRLQVFLCLAGWCSGRRAETRQEVVQNELFGQEMI